MPFTLLLGVGAAWASERASAARSALGGVWQNEVGKDSCLHHCAAPAVGYLHGGVPASRSARKRWWAGRYSMCEALVSNRTDRPEISVPGARRCALYPGGRADGGLVGGTVTGRRWLPAVGPSSRAPLRLAREASGLTGSVVEGRIAPARAAARVSIAASLGPARPHDVALVMRSVVFPGDAVAIRLVALVPPPRIHDYVARTLVVDASGLSAAERQSLRRAPCATVSSMAAATRFGRASLYVRPAPMRRALSSACGI